MEEPAEKQSEKPALINLHPYVISIRFFHPTIDPEEITSALGISPKRSFKVGDQKSAPNGSKLQGTNEMTYWTLSQQYTGDKCFFKKVEEALDLFNGREPFLQSFTKGGGKVEFWVSLPGKTNRGDTLTPNILGAIANLGIHLSVEVYPEINRSHSCIDL